MFKWRPMQCILASLLCMTQIQSIFNDPVIPIIRHVIARSEHLISLEADPSELYATATTRQPTTSISMNHSQQCNGWDNPKIEFNLIKVLPSFKYLEKEVRNAFIHSKGAENIEFEMPKVLNRKLMSTQDSRNSLRSKFGSRTLENSINFDASKDASLLMELADNDGSMLRSFDELAAESAPFLREYNDDDKVGARARLPKDSDHTTAPSKDVKPPKNASCCAHKTSTTEKAEEKLEHAQVLSKYVDEKSGPCFRVSLTVALIVLGIIMLLSCCCACLLRNRLFACCGKMRRKKKKSNQHYAVDEEQGFVGQKSHQSVPQKGSGRKAGGYPDLINVGTQNSIIPSNPSMESDEKPTGCCKCCYKKKKKHGKKRKS